MRIKACKGPAVPWHRRWIAMLLALTIITVNVPRAAAPPSLDAPPAGPFLVNDGRLFHIDLSGIGAAAELAHGFGAFEVSISRAIFAGDDVRESSVDFAIDETDENAGFVLLDSAEEVRRATGLDAGQAVGWREAVSWSVAGGLAEITTTYRVGDDRVTTTIPREFLGLEPASDSPSFFSIEVNGQTADVDSNVVRRVLDGDPVDPLLEQSLGGLTDGFHDKGRFGDAVRAIAVGLGLAGSGRPEPLEAGMVTPHTDCAIPCLKCFGSLLGYAGSTIALIVACGSVVFTGPASVAACAGVFLGHEGVTIIALMNCAECGSCVGDRDDGEGDGGAAPPDDPVECCPCLGLPLCDCSILCTS